MGGRCVVDLKADLNEANKSEPNRDQIKYSGKFNVFLKFKILLRHLNMLRSFIALFTKFHEIIFLKISN